MHQKILEFATLDSYSVHKLKTTWDTKFVDLYSEMIRMYLLTVYLLNFRMGCCTTINHCTTLHLLSIWDLIEMWNIAMPTTGSCLNLVTSGSNEQRVTTITPSKALFRLLLYYTLTGLCWIKSSKFTSPCPPEKLYPPFLNGARRLNNGYYVLKSKNMQWWLHQCTKLCMVGLIVLMGSSGLSNRLICCVFYLLERLLDQHIQRKRILHQTGSIAYGL